MEKDLSFWEHLEVFRWMLFRVLIAVFIVAIAAFACMPYMFEEYILAPTNADFFVYRYLCNLTSSVPFVPDFCDSSFHVDIINLQLASQFFRHMSTSFWLAVIITFPYLIYEIWYFVSPALYPSEKKKIRFVFVVGTVMFFMGCIFGYSVVFPMTFRFLATYQLSDMIVNQISLDSYMDNFLMLIFIMGIVFELPLISWLLSKLGILHRSFFYSYRKHAVVILLVLSAFITPSGDPFTLAVVFFPLYLLYEVSYLLVKD